MMRFFFIFTTASRLALGPSHRTNRYYG